MREEQERTGLLLGEEGIQCLEKAHVIVFGVGGVGGFCIEALVRAGIGAITIVDHDVVSLSNINRQIIADHTTVGKKKVDVMEKRIKCINEKCQVTKRDCFYLPETSSSFDFSEYDYVIDAIDTVTAKIHLIIEAQKEGTPVISSMGTGNKLHPECFQITDIYKTSICPLAKVMRRELRKRGVKKLKVLFSTEEPVKSAIKIEEPKDSKRVKPVPGSVSFCPSVAGLLIAGEVIRELAGK